MLDYKVYDELLSLLEYRDDGHFYHRQNNPKRRAGEKAGYVNSHGYVFLSLGPQKVFAHRAAYYATYGYLPKVIDHINGDKTDNRISNLRECTQGQNVCNSKCRKNSKTGIKNVTWVKSINKYKVQVTVNGKMTYGGCFDDLEEAKFIATQMRQKLHGDFANNG